MTPASATSPVQLPGSLPPERGRTMPPPTASSPKMSHTDRSKLNEDRARTRSPDAIANRSLMSSIVLTAERCSIMTPLGTPVEPDVKMT